MDTANHETADVSDAVEASSDVVSTFPPAGWVRRAEAAAMMGMTIEVFKARRARGQVPKGKVVAKPGRGWCTVYPVRELEQARARIAEERGRLPDGMIAMHEAWTMLGTSRSNWKRWRRRGWVPPGRMVEVGGMRNKVRAYTLDEVRAIAEVLERLGKPYPDPDRPGCVRVPVMSFWRSIREAIIDEADLPIVQGKRWNWGDRADGFAPAVVEARPDKGHPLKYILFGVSPGEVVIDHANDDPLDCRRANLIVRTRSQKCAGMRKMRHYGGSPTTSRFKGVSWDKHRAVWRVLIKHAENSRYLGRFDDEIDAAMAYDEAASELFGEHARLNFPDGVDKWLEQHANANEPEMRRAA